MHISRDDAIKIKVSVKLKILMDSKSIITGMHNFTFIHVESSPNDPDALARILLKDNFKKDTTIFLEDVVIQGDLDYVNNLSLFINVKKVEAFSFLNITIHQKADIEK